MTDPLNKLIDVGIHVLDHLPVAGDVAHAELNRVLINEYAHATDARPRAYSLWSPVPAKDAAGTAVDPAAEDYITDYTSWPGLTNKVFSGRHLKPAGRDWVDGLPADAPYRPGAPLGQVTDLFARRGPMKPSRSSVLFTFFAQWFTDSILRFDPTDRRRNTSNHDIDLCQVYGLTDSTTRCLRERSGGRIRTRQVDGEEYLDRLCESRDGRFVVREPYLDLPANQKDLDAILGDFSDIVPSRKEHLYATGLERGNSSIGYVAMSTLFVREHNRIAGELRHQNPGWNDERIFQTARNITIVLELKLIVEDYINHIVGHRFFKLDHSFAEKQHWYRANWIAVEFDMLYRWHGLVPDVVFLRPDDPSGPKLHAREFRNNNALFETIGLGPLLDAASRQPAGQVGLGNTPDFLWAAENKNISMARDFRLASYNDYREQFTLPRLTDFSELTRDTEVQAKLERLYGTIDRVEYLVGLFAEQPRPGLIFGDLLNRMVAYDAFTQIFSNPLLSLNVYTADTFTDYGLELIERTTSLQVLAERNVSGNFLASLGVVKPAAHEERESVPEVGSHHEELAIDTLLGEERAEREDDVARKIAASVRAKLERARAEGKPLVRDAHPKSHGLVRAVFRVEDRLPAELARGAFVPGKSYDAWVRFSNGNEDPRRSDAKGDSRGMAIKLLGVPGEKILPGEENATTQDFVMIDHPTFIVDDPARYLQIVGGSNSTNFFQIIRTPFALGIHGAMNLRAITSHTIGSPLEARYWSTTAYALGTGEDRVAVKYSARPLHSAKTPIPDHPAPDFLRQTMIRQLEDGNRTFEFLVQVRATRAMSVERTTVEWSEDEAPFRKVATLTIPKQTFSTAKQDAYGENLSFTPWHALPAHRPLGGINRVRRIVYEEISRLRHDLAGTTREEPTKIESFE